MRILDSVVFTEEHQYEDDTDSLQVKPIPRIRKNIPPPVAPRRRTTVTYEKDRSMTEVSDGEAVEENFEKFGVWRLETFHSILFHFKFSESFHLHGFSCFINTFS